METFYRAERTTSHWINVIVTSHAFVYAPAETGTSDNANKKRMVRFKNRYLVFKVLWEEPYTIQKDLTSSHIHQIIRQNVETYFGDLGVASLAQCLTGIFFLNCA